MQKKTPINIADLKGLINILTDVTLNVTDIVEALNRRIVHPPFLPSTPIQHLITGISGVMYKGVRLGTKAVGGGLEKTLAQFNPALNLGVSLEQKEDLVSVLNGVVGDYLADNNNPLAIRMEIRHQGENIFSTAKQQLPKIKNKILLLVHGSCTPDAKWTQLDHNHGELLAKELGMTVLYVNYNSGLHISTNGQYLNNLLERLAQKMEVEELIIIGHSMGGLVTRSAVHYGKERKSTWTEQLTKMVFLGSPHHGAPLEKVGNYIDRFMSVIPYVKPFSRLGKLRSGGVTDLRYGNLVDEDWKGLDRFAKLPDNRTPIPLPKKVDCYAVAACINKKSEATKLKSRLVGDGLVQVKSALGKHKKANKKLRFKSKNTYIVYETNHFDLLTSRKVYEQLQKWLLET